MDDRNDLTSSPDLYVQLGFDIAPTGPGVRPPADLEHKLVVPNRNRVEGLSADPLRESPVVVYCGNEQRIREGFALALRAMGVEANILQAEVSPPATNPNREDN